MGKAESCPFVRQNDAFINNKLWLARQEILHLRAIFAVENRASHIGQPAAGFDIGRAASESAPVAVQFGSAGAVKRHLVSGRAATPDPLHGTSAIPNWLDRQVFAIFIAYSTISTPARRACGRSFIRAATASWAKITPLLSISAASAKALPPAPAQ